MKISKFLISLLLIGGCCGGCFSSSSLISGPGAVLYGDDNRADIFQVKNTRVLKNADAVASSWDAYKIKDNGDGTSTLRVTEFKSSYRLSPKEPFGSQPIGAHCTSFLVAPDILVTAGHCLNKNDFKTKKFVFGFRMKCCATAVTTVNNSQIYSAKEIIAHQLNTTGMDYAVIRLDRKVKLVTPLKMAPQDAKAGDWLYVLGHPCGLPLKFANQARVISSYSSIYFTATLDTYGGNSGSPVFNTNHEVVGILVRGETDFVSISSGRVSRQGRNGESVTKVSNWKGFVK